MTANVPSIIIPVTKADAEYDNYGGKLEEQTGEVRFIIETDGID